MSKICFDEHYGLQSAVLHRVKTNTRRTEKGLSSLPVKVRDDEYFITHWEGDCFLVRKYAGGALLDQAHFKPKFKVGDIVAIAQSYKDADIDPSTIVKMIDEGQNMFTPVPAFESAGWKNKLFVKEELMPHNIEITDVRLQHLQGITDEDALKEGVRLFGEQDHLDVAQYYVPGLTHPRTQIHRTFATPREAFAALIDKMNGKGTWKSNPWVVAYTFVLVD